LADNDVAALESIAVPSGTPLALACDDRQKSCPRPRPIERERVMSEHLNIGELSAEERDLITLLRQGPQSIKGLAEAMCIDPEQTQEFLDSLNRKVGIVPLFRYETLRYGLAE
jgi:hypothetical protein